MRVRRNKRTTDGRSSMTGVFLSYLRSDSAPYAHMLSANLRERGFEVFVDIEAIEVGEDFVESIDRAIGACDVVLALIGPDWLSNTDPTGQRRIDQQTDFVRLELLAAIRREIVLIPVLVGGASMPALSDLPPALSEVGTQVAMRQALEMRDERWDQDVEMLVSTLRHHESTRTRPPAQVSPPEGAESSLAPRPEAIEIPESHARASVRPGSDRARPRAFISYRRKDSLVHARLLALSLEHYVNAEVFLDVDAVRSGRKYAGQYEKAVSACDVFFVLIGDQWLHARDKEGRPRIWDEADHVHKEIRAALPRGVPVIPLLIQGAEMPESDELPPDIKELEEWEAKPLRDETWTQDFDLVAKDFLAIWGSG
jgi:TIR domain